MQCTGSFKYRRWDRNTLCGTEHHISRLPKASSRSSARLTNVDRVKGINQWVLPFLSSSLVFDVEGFGDGLQRSFGGVGCGLNPLVRSTVLSLDAHPFLASRLRIEDFVVSPDSVSLEVNHRRAAPLGKGGTRKRGWGSRGKSGGYEECSESNGKHGEMIGVREKECVECLSSGYCYALIANHTNFYTSARLSTGDIICAVEVKS